MLNRCGPMVAVALLLFGSFPNGADAEAMTGAGIRKIASAADMASAERSRVPIGHRQPRPRDIPLSVGLSPTDAELRRLDADVDKKLIICHGC